VKNYPGDVRDFTLTFSYKDPRVATEVDLIPNGSNIEVTNANRVEYAYRVANYKLSSQLKKQIEAFLAGLNEIIPVNFLKLFTAAELQSVISGEEKDLDVADLRSNSNIHVICFYLKKRGLMAGWTGNICRISGLCWKIRQKRRNLNF
jgi:hypothetical protein